MSHAARYRALSGGKRMHFQHGPIDLIIEARGDDAEVALAYQQGRQAFADVLPNLVTELLRLRRPLCSSECDVSGLVAMRMVSAASPHRKRGFMTPMIAVAGAVADYILDAIVEDRTLDSAYVNNGGDIAVYLAVGQTFRIGICDVPEARNIAATVMLCASDTIRGVATSGWRGRSHSLGIADAVTVLAHNAASADVAATLIANAVDLPDSPCVRRVPAVELTLDSDLGERGVTVSVAALSTADVHRALNKGARVAREMIADGAIAAAYLALQGVAISEIGVHAKTAVANRLSAGEAGSRVGDGALA